MAGVGGGGGGGVVVPSTPLPCPFFRPHLTFELPPPDIPTTYYSPSFNNNSLIRTPVYYIYTYIGRFQPSTVSVSISISALQRAREWGGTWGFFVNGSDAGSMYARLARARQDFDLIDDLFHELKPGNPYPVKPSTQRQGTGVIGKIGVHNLVHDEVRECIIIQLI